ncbi:MAG: DUF4249 domain-containing protein [Salinivirgaceae bacterium]|jgi:hypothetical protein|nr:DUF4249 domain-containing protein [Salinivirgaceae bacterium]
MKNFIAIILASILFASCEDVIDVKLNDKDQDLYAIEAKITTIDNPWVIVSKVLPVTVDEAYDGISNAVVTIFDNAEPSNAVILVEDTEMKGYYEVPENESYMGTAGRTYTLSILTPEGSTISATETIYPVVPVDSIQIWPSMRGDKRFLGVFTFGNETPGPGDYYKWDIYVNDTLLNDVGSMAFASDEMVDGNYISSLEIFTDFHDPSEESERILGFEDTVYIKQTSISEFAYYYYFQMVNQASTGSMFSVPPANIPSNFTASNGEKVYGLFTAHDVSVSNSVVIDQAIENEIRKD